MKSTVPHFTTVSQPVSHCLTDCPASVKHVSLKQNVYNKWTIYTYINTVQYMVVDIDEDGIEYI